MDHLIDLNFSAKKRRRNSPEVRPRDGHVEHVCTASGSIPRKRRGHLEFCAKERVRYAFSFKWLDFYVGPSFFARFCSIMLNIGRLDVRFFARIFFLQTCLGVALTGSCKMRRDCFSSPLGKKPEC